MLPFRLRNLLLLIVAISALALVAVACGGEDPTAATTAPAAAPATSAPAPTAAAAPTAVPLGTAADAHDGDGGVPCDADA